MPSARKPYRYILIVAGVVGVLVTLGIVWPRPVSHDPKTVFWNALRANLTQPGLTCSISDAANGSSTQQALSLDLANKTDVRALTQINQSKTSITTEQLDTKNASYIRYTALHTSQVRADGTKPDLSQALNVWSKATTATGTMFGKAALGNCVVPLADLTKEQVEPLLLELQKNKVFTTNFSLAKSTNLNAKPVLVYEVTIPARPYIDFMKQVAKTYSLKTLDAVQAATYDKKTAQHLKFYVSLQTARLQKISYTDRQRSVGFSDYGQRPTIVVPQQTVTPQQLQQLLQPR